MGVMDVIRSRRSVRKWKDQPVDKTKLDILMKAAQDAPSAVNWQPYRFVLVDDPERRRIISKAAAQPYLAKAPLLVVGVSDPDKSPTWHLIDTTIALTHILLAAYEVGLGGVFIGAFDEGQVKGALGIPKDKVVGGILALGVPDAKPGPKTRKSIETLFSKNSYDVSVKP
ncbi:MAG: nitroreductase family protein [Candidatus Atabeyarchaeum deiterrae]